MAGTYTPVSLNVEVTGEKLDLVTILADQRQMLAITARGITDDQARERTTASDFTLGALIKHVATVIRDNVSMLQARDENSALDMSELEEAFTFGPDQSIEYWLGELGAAGDALEEYIASVDLDDMIPQPTAPWEPERVWMTARQVLLHLLREIAHHSGHADIIRETLDGQTTMAAIWTPPAGE
ncbi:hypothetical protein GCM10007304_36720 [Rhodococcoides trifolii]|uniref:DinB family protein n=1 Tax=Rhodococcoides trifolii TaxID=908250 RepID=A0A917G336_9NOCA|nr:DUF664 domain-containing protein [Rhodococcus trifolii]GGG19458.1 hypothetical protein GCM10007304_36720 [Rhodococcus trifolii]